MPELSYPGTIVVSLFASVAAEFFTLPLDTLKTRIQASSATCVTISDTVNVIYSIYNRDGVSGFLQGLEPALMRQV